MSDPLFARILAAAKARDWMLVGIYMNEAQGSTMSARAEDVTTLCTLARVSSHPAAKRVLDELLDYATPVTLPLSTEFSRHTRLCVQHKTRKEERYFLPVGRGDMTIAATLSAFAAVRPDFPEHVTLADYDMSLCVLPRGVLAPYESFEAHVAVHGTHTLSTMPPREDEEEDDE